MICLLQLRGGSAGVIMAKAKLPVLADEGTHYLLGKNLPGSGILCRYSRSALSFHTAPVMATMARPKTAVLAFQLEG